MSKTLKRVLISLVLIVLVVSFFLLDYFLDKQGAWLGNYPAGLIISFFAIIIGMLAAFEMLKMFKLDIDKLTRKVTLIAVVLFILGAVFIGHKTLHNTNINDSAALLTAEEWNASETGTFEFMYLPNELIGNVVKTQVLLNSVYLFGFTVFFMIFVWVRNLWSFGNTELAHEKRIKSATSAMIVFLLTALPFAFAVLMRMIPIFGFGLIVFTLAVSRLGDAGAYIFGKLFGKHKLIVNVSPKKTIEGCIGGVLTSAIIGAVVTYFFNLHVLFQADYWIIGALIGAVVGISAQLADLVSSAIKRKANVKDSGKFIPELGGVLDVVDNFMFSLPVMYFIILVIWII